MCDVWIPALIYLIDVNNLLIILKLCDYVINVLKI